MSEFLPLNADFAEQPEVLRVEPLYSDNEKSVALVALNGTNQAIVNRLSTTTYQVIAGNGVMHLPGKNVELKNGSELTVPAKTPYYDEGSVVMIATSIPPFDPEHVETVEHDAIAEYRKGKQGWSTNPQREAFLHVLADIFSRGYTLTAPETGEIAVHYGYSRGSAVGLLGGHVTRKALAKRGVKLDDTFYRRRRIFLDKTIPEELTDLAARKAAIDQSIKGRYR